MIEVRCPECNSLATYRESFGWWRCDDCGHLFEYWNRRDQLDRDLDMCPICADVVLL